MIYKVKKVGRKVLHDYDGMNVDAAKKMGFPWHYSKNTILVDKTLPKKTKDKVVVHEIVEKRLMDKGLPYWKAHELSLKKWKK